MFTYPYTDPMINRWSSRIIRVAVAEDHDILRQDFSEMIENRPQMEWAGAAATGNEAVELALQANPDIMLMDIEMESHQDGIEAANRLSVLRPELGIIFLTVHEDDETIYKAYTLTNARDYLVKSAEHDEIIRSIEYAYEEQKHGSSSMSSKLKSEFSRLKQTESKLIFFMSILSQLTQAERDIIKLLLASCKVEDMARLRMVEPVTIKSQINTLLKKFGMKRTKEISSLIRELNVAFIFE
ncbi:response regulator transcription factor [Paenibacillus sp. LHD-117]|uniref:response regulator transcription factor n=1 Tax=Paenibacillus sp. LHD-117 TaxID=3071412 RepID=UPI0027DF294F|nr:response regulator transcription factor [Paenibacillus sp. LHD-117]MDQ6422957.1 response regulator transcription factor [Paenibacillus sp. LHD-117]